MSWQEWLVVGVIAAAMLTLVLDRYPTSVVLAAGLLVLLVSGAIDAETALSGLSSPAMVTIGALYIVAAAVSITGAMRWALDWMLFGGGVRLARMTFIISALSSVVPNTPLVALAAPRVVRWCRANGESASSYLMPLSFATILGGTITLLGTSTNLVISDGLEKAGEPALGVFEMTPVTVPIAAIGAAVMALTTPRLMRNRESAAVRQAQRRFEAQMLVNTGGPLDGVTVAQGGLRDLDGLFLAAIERDGRTTTAGSASVLRGGDHLLFVGDIEHLVDLEDIAGLSSAEEEHLVDTEGPGVVLYEAVVSTGSELSGQTLKSSDFRSRYGAAVLAIERASGVVPGKLGQLPLAPGDVLVVLAGPAFGRHWGQSRDFSTVASLREPPPRRRNRAPVAAAALLGMIVIVAAGLLPLLTASLVAAVVVVAGGALSMGEARHAINVNVMLTIAASIGMGAAVEDTGLALRIADWVLSLSDPLGSTGLVAVVVVATLILTELISNTGAAALMLPVAISAGASSAVDPRALAIAVLVGASCSFLTPIGYQTNLMVYGLGGYRFGDFARVGFPLTISVVVVATLMLGVVY